MTTLLVCALIALLGAPRPAPLAIPAAAIHAPGPSTGVTTVVGAASRTDAVRTPAPPSFRAVRGTATWYDWKPREAAAGPGLRRAIGRDWRGSWVRVCVDGIDCIAVKLTDWCGCPRGRVIDLDRRSFARLAAPSRGVIPVTVYPLPDLPATDR